MRRFIYLLVAISLIMLNGVFAQTFDWVYPYAKYRLVYNFTLDADYTDVYVNITIPTTVLDNVLAYCQLLGKLHCDEAYPRVYYYNATTGSQVQVTDITYVSTYNGYPQVIRVYFPSLSAGSHYILIYYPYIWSDDFEDNALGESVSASGACLSDGWCLASVAVIGSASIDSSGVLPTPGKRLHIYTSTSPYAAPSYAVVERLINLIINKDYLLIAEFDISFSSPFPTSAGAWLGFTFQLVDGSNVTIAYSLARNYAPPNFNICAWIPISNGHQKIDLFNDLSKYCNIPISEVSQLLAIYGVAYFPASTSYVDLYIDNLKLVHKYQ